MKGYTFGELRKQFKDMYVIVSVECYDERGFANIYKLYGVAKSKRDIEKMYPDIQKKHPESYIHETFRRSENCFRFRMIDNILTKIPAYNASECAELFRHYYNLQ